MKNKFNFDLNAEIDGVKAIGNVSFENEITLEELLECFKQRDKESKEALSQIKEIWAGVKAELKNKELLKDAAEWYKEFCALIDPPKEEDHECSCGDDCKNKKRKGKGWM